MKLTGQNNFSLDLFEENGVRYSRLYASQIDTVLWQRYDPKRGWFFCHMHEADLMESRYKDFMGINDFNDEEDD